MKRLGRKIYTNTKGNSVFAVVTSDRNSKKLAADIYIEYRNGEFSDIITLQRKNILTSSKCFDFLLDIEGGFSQMDIIVIKSEMRKFVTDCKETVEIQTRATFDELYHSICSFVYANSTDISNADNPRIFVKNGYGYIMTEYMDKFAKDNAFLGYNRIEILKRLKIFGVLENSKNRPYDALISVKGKKLRCYKIKLLEKVGTINNEEAEVII